MCSLYTYTRIGQKKTKKKKNTHQIPFRFVVIVALADLNYPKIKTTQTERTNEKIKIKKKI